ncbi:AAA family ATPase, partial [Lachnotalea glycerini]
MDSISELIIYKHFKNGNLLYDMTWIMENYENEYYNHSDIKALLYDRVNELIELAEQYGFLGNVWHNYLALLLANNENAYSTACEIVGEVNGTINEIALNDFRIFRKLFNFDFTVLERTFHAGCLSLLVNYKSATSNGKIFNKRIRDRICDLSIKLSGSENEFDFKEIMTNFYKDFGVGKLGLHKAFRVEHVDHETKLVPITNIQHVHLDDLVGYELQKKKLIDNT